RRRVRVSRAAAVLLGQLWIDDWPRPVGRFRMPDRVDLVMGQHPQGKCVFLRGSRLLHRSRIEIARSDIVQKVGKQVAAEGKIPEVREMRSAARVAARIIQFLLSRVRKTLAYHWQQSRVP